MFFDLNSGVIEEFTVEDIVEYDNANHRVLHLTLLTDLGETKYRICADGNEGPLEAIKRELENTKNQIKNEGLHFKINEFPERSYIYITYPDGVTKKYTGQRL